MKTKIIHRGITAQNGPQNEERMIAGLQLIFRSLGGTTRKNSNRVIQR